MANIYTTCDEIPLCKFIEMYKGNLNALVKSGTPSREDLERAAVSMLDEYSALTNNKNIAIEIEDRSRAVDCNIKLILLESADHLIDAMMYTDASDILGRVGIRMPEEPGEQDLIVAKKRIQSKMSQVKYNLSVLDRNKSKVVDPKDKDFTRERMIVSTYFKMRIDPGTFTAAEYGNMIRIMFNQLEDMRNYGGKRD